MTWWKVLVLSVAFYSECASRRPRILNGHDANIEDFPYQASLRYGGSHWCGGSILSERHILTAAHCIKTAPPYMMTAVVTGTSLSFLKGNYHKIDKIKIHSNYSNNGKRTWNDIAIITLKNKVVFDKYQQKINLPEHNPEAGQKVNVTGWGWAQQVPVIIRPNQLQQLQIQLASNENCQKKVIDSETMKITDTEICTLDSRGSGTCAGDSGGPLVANGEVIGITAWGGEYCGSDTPDVFTNVYKFKSFIESAMNDVA